MPEISVVQFYGDLNNQNPVKKTYDQSTWGVALNAGKQFKPWLGVRGKLFYSQLRSEYNDYTFSADVVLSTHMLATIDFLNLLEGTYPRIGIVDLSVYFMGGIGFTNWRTRLYDEEGKVVAGNGNQGNGPFGLTTETTIPLGMGVAILGKHNINAQFSFLWNIVNSDKLDSRVGEFRFDQYFTASLGIAYNFNISNKEKEKPLPVRSYWDIPDMRNMSIKEVASSTVAEPTIDTTARFEWGVWLGWSEYRLTADHFIHKYSIYAASWFKRMFKEIRSGNGYMYYIGPYTSAKQAGLYMTHLKMYNIQGLKRIQILKK